MSGFARFSPGLGITPGMADKRTAAERREDEAEVRIGWKMAGLGMEVSAQAVAGAILGWVIDYLRGGGHLWVFIGAGTGIVVGLWTLIKGGLQLNKKLDALAAQRRTERSAAKAPTNAPPSAGDNENDWNDNDQWDKWSDDDADKSSV